MLLGKPLPKPLASLDSPAQVPAQLVVDESVAPMEKNGFTLIDVSPKKISLRMFAWRPPEPPSKIDTLEPFQVEEIAT